MSAETVTTNMAAEGPHTGAVRSVADDAIEEALKELASFSGRQGNSANAERVRQLAERYHTQTFNLVVFGEFKRGKTTFINALLGDDLLPSAVIPLTSAVTIIHYSPSPRIEVEFLDGRVQAITREELADYVTESGNPENSRRVRLVRVGAPCELLRNGMQLVDTPGVGSVYDHNTETTRDFLPHVDGAILLVASDPPISRRECEFLLEMRPHVARLFVVQNKLDQLRLEDREISLDFTCSVLRQLLDADQVEVFPMSAREALDARLTGDAARLAESGLLAFEEELRRFQATEQLEALRASVTNGATAVIEDEKLGLDLEGQALRMTVAELDERYAEFVRRREEILRQREDDTTLIKETARRLITRTIQQDYSTERARQGPLLEERLQRWLEDRGQLAPAELLEQGNVFIRQTLFDVLGQWREAEERTIEQHLQASLDRFTSRTNEVLSSIYEAAREVFDLPPRSVETVGRLVAPSRFLWREWDWEPRLGVSGSAMLRLLPGARERVVRAIRSHLLEEHDKACGRLRHDFAERARAAFDDYIASMDHSLQQTIGGIDRAIRRVVSQKREVTEDVSEAEQRLVRQRAQLAAIAATLAPVSA